MDRIPVFILEKIPFSTVDVRFVVALDAEALLEMGRTDTSGQVPHTGVIIGKIMHVQQLVEEGWKSTQRESPWNYTP